MIVTGTAHTIELTVPNRPWHSDDDRKRASYGLIAASMSAQGHRFLPLPNSVALPSRTFKGVPSLSVVKLPEAEVPAGIREELAKLPTDRRDSRVVTMGEGHLGSLLTDVKRTFGLPLFGAGPRDTKVKLPNHKEFTASNLVAGGGFIGLALLLPRATVRPNQEGRMWMGCLVPFPELIGLPSDTSDGGVNIKELRNYLEARFEDDILESAVDRLVRLAGSGMNTGQAIVPSGGPDALRTKLRSAHHFGKSSPFVSLTKLGPSPRWTF